MSFAFDVKCFLGTIVSIIKREGVVEGRTGASKQVMNKDKSIK